MTHFSPWPRLRLAIEVETGPGLGEQFTPIVDRVSQQIFHFGIGMAFGGAERQTANRAYRLFELTGGTSVDRPMA